MKKSNLYYIFLVLLLITGCSSSTSPSTDAPVTTQTNTPVTSDAFGAIHESPLPNDCASTDITNTTTMAQNNTSQPQYHLEQTDDGSFTKTWTDSHENVLQQITYNSTNDETTLRSYKYDLFDVVYYEAEYKGPGNLSHEFEAGNYTHATEESMTDFSGSGGGYEIDMAHAFDVTRDDLAPLYEKAKNIYDKYGVIVLIADKIADETGGAEPCYDYNLIDPCLDLIEQTLSIYPTDFFRNFSDMSLQRTLCIQLVGTGYAPGVYFDGSEALLLQIDVNCYTPDSDDDGSFFIYTLDHEIGHAINKRLFTRASGVDYPLTEEKWSSYNPQGFEYTQGNSANEIYDSGDTAEYFVYSYSCESAEEDRATIFGYAMSYYRGNEDESFSFNDKVDAKLKYLSECIRSGFRCNWPEQLPWEAVLEV